MRRPHPALVTARTALVSSALVPALVLVAPTPVHADPVGGPALTTHGRAVVVPGATPLPDVAATSWVVADADTGAVLAAKAPHLPHRPASTLKTLTAITLMPHLDPDAEHRVTAQEMAPVYGSRAGIVAGATYTVDDLWHALLLPSGNDAAAALAGAYGGRKKTVAAMNAEATRLQATDTHAVNPSGLDADGQVTSAYDMALFARAAIAMPEFVRVSGTVSYDLPGSMPKPGKKRGTFKIYGQNRLLNDGYKGVIAGKTGYTSLAGRTFWVAAERGGRTVIVALMGIQEATETAASKLMTWGLKNAGSSAAVGTLVAPLDPDDPTTGAGTPPATTTDEGAGSGAGDGLAAGGTTTAAARGLSPALLALVGAVLVLLVLALAVVLVRRRRPAPTGAVTPAPADAAPVPSGAAPLEAPAATVPAATPPAADPPAVRAAPVPPTGNVTVVRPPRRED